MEERFVDNDGVRIRYLDRAPDAAVGFPVVFVPGLVDVVDDYHESFVDFDRRVLVVELRGRGRSDAPADEYSAEAQASDVEAVIDAAGLGAFHLMTFSRGTTPGLLAALRGNREVLSVSIGDYLAGEIGLPADFVDRMWEGRWRGTPNSERVQRHALAGIQASSQPRELWDAVGGMALPVLVARGGDGSFVDDAAADRYRAAIPDVEIIDIPGSGHDIFRPSRSAYPRAVLDFIARRAPGT
jgi:pimeloyl-ACP methyl ester carboxylesterase